MIRDSPTRHLIKKLVPGYYWLWQPAGVLIPQSAWGRALWSIEGNCGSREHLVHRLCNRLRMARKEVALWPARTSGIGIKSDQVRQAMLRQKHSLLHILSVAILRDLRQVRMCGWSGAGRHGQKSKCCHTHLQSPQEIKSHQQLCGGT